MVISLREGGDVLKSYYIYSKCIVFFIQIESYIQYLQDIGCNLHVTRLHGKKYCKVANIT